MPQIVFKGTVFSGKGEGKKFIDLPWVKHQIQEKLGFTPYSGTLNIHLTKESTEKKKLLAKTKQLEIIPERGYCRGLLIKAEVDNLNCAMVVPQVLSYPNDVLEIIAPVYLRERYKLADGTSLTVTVNV